MAGTAGQPAVAPGAGRLVRRRVDIGCQKPSKAVFEATSAGGAGLAFPDGEDAPAEAAEGAEMVAVAGGVLVDFGEPVIAAGGGNAASAAGMAVPEAAVDKDDLAVAGEDEVGGAGEGSCVESVAESEGVDEAAVLCVVKISRNFVQLLHARVRTIFMYIKSAAVVQHDEKADRISGIVMNKDDPTTWSAFNLNVRFFVIEPIVCSEQKSCSFEVPDQYRDIRFAKVRSARVLRGKICWHVHAPYFGYIRCLRSELGLS